MDDDSTTRFEISLADGWPVLVLVAPFEPDPTLETKNRLSQDWLDWFLLTYSLLSSGASRWKKGAAGAAMYER